LNLFITGASGFLGRSLLARLVLLPQYEHVYALIRPTRKHSSIERLELVVREQFPAGVVDEVLARVTVLDGDLSKLRLGLDHSTYCGLADRVQHILHVGASTAFGMCLAEARRINVEGTREILNFAADCRTSSDFYRLEYISTAYVAGTGPGEAAEDSFPGGQRFANTYEQSKFEAEQLVRSRMADIPCAIYRPSIIVGDSRTGFTPHFKTLYFPLRLAAKRIVSFFPCNGKARLDVVPVDYVADAVTALISRPDTTGETFHLTAGRGRELGLRQLVRDADRFAAIAMPQAIPSWMFEVAMRRPCRWLIPKSYWDAIAVAFPYKAYFLGQSASFNSKKTEAVLRSLGIEVPRWENYGPTVLAYIARSQWGKVVIEDLLPRSLWTPRRSVLQNA
jgi:thioester reductase-like protein